MRSTRGVCAYAAWHQMVPICLERWCMEANEATQTHCYNPVALTYPVWAYYEHGQQCRCQEDPVSLPSSKLEKTTRSSPHHVAQHHPIGSEITPSYAPRSSRFVSKPPSVEDDVDVWHYAILELHARNDDDDLTHNIGHFWDYFMVNWINYNDRTLSRIGILTVLLKTVRLRDRTCSQRSSSPSTLLLTTGTTASSTLPFTVTAGDVAPTNTT